MDAEVFDIVVFGGDKVGKALAMDRAKAGSWGCARRARMAMAPNLSKSQLAPRYRTAAN